MPASPRLDKQVPSSDVHFSGQVMIPDKPAIAAAARAKGEHHRSGEGWYSGCDFPWLSDSSSLPVQPCSVDKFGQPCVE